MSLPGDKPLRLLVVCPSWVGDAVMATPALDRLRSDLPGAFIGALVRPGIDRVLAGAGFFDEVHVERAGGVMGPKFVAAKVRPRRYDTAVLLTNSFSTALIARIAGIPRRIGYDRDGRGLLLTDRLKPEKRDAGGWAIVPAADYYWRLIDALLSGPPGDARLPDGAAMRLATTPEEEAEADAILERAGVGEGERYCVLNPGGNNPAKRWPADRFAELGRRLREEHQMAALVNGSPGEAELTAEIAGACGGVDLVALGNTLGALKAIVKRAGLMVTNDTGPRHIAVAFGVPTVSLFGPTDHRWTIVPKGSGGGEVVLLADPTLPETESANDHPERCRIDRIGAERVWEAVSGLLGGIGST
ncbi:MAG: glycosyltransferase family 9 protein [Phycisphaerales bacterium]|nr:MAG: glycosyltransferase family 9 protein [Phycisphaerales bacterium]